MKVGRRACSGALAVLALASACDGVISLGSSGADAEGPGATIDGATLGSSSGASGGSSGSSSGGAASSSSSGGASGSSSGGGPMPDAGILDATVPPDSGPEGGPGGCSSGACGPPPPSCSAPGSGLTNCGAGGESCCTSLDVPGGTFYRTYRNTGTGPTAEADPATVSGFRLDKYDVTVGRFRQFVKAVLPPDGGAGWTPPDGSGKHAHLNGGQGLLAVGVPEAGTQFELGWNGPLYNSSVAPTDGNLSGGTWTPSAGAGENLPITRVNWYEAYAFCIWDGGFLPSQAEWEYAAAGGSEQREYPWGSADPGSAGQYAIYDYYTYCQLDGGGPCFDARPPGLDVIAPVGSAPGGAGRWGQLDLAGNANQWLLDWYGPAFVVPCVDCADVLVGPASGGIYRGYAGGGADEPASHMMTWLGYSGFGPDYRYVAGFRCSRPPEGGAPDASTPPDAGPPAAPSCRAGGDGLTNCGANSESCCTSFVVEGGTYYRSYDLTAGGLTLAADGGPAAEADPATISTFRLDKYEVTVGRFRQFVNAWNGGSGLDGGPGYVPPAGSGKHTHLNGGNGLNATGAPGGASDAGYAGYEPGWASSDNGKIAPTDVDLDCVGDCSYGVNALDGVGQPIGTWNELATWTPSPGNNETLPIDGVNWFEAYAFCIWDGGFLPSEAEWEYAAAGGSDQREYPWGALAAGPGDSRYAIYQGDYGDGGALTHIAPVGTAALGAGRWGQLDLLGNVYEWTLDFYPRSGTYFDPCTDCSDWTSAPTRAFHGGDFDSLISVGIPSYRLSENPMLRPWTEGAWPTGTPTSPMAGSTVGFRCARTP